MPPAATIRLGRAVATRTRLRWGHLRRTGMGCMTWRGTCGSGGGIGMTAPTMVVPRRPTLVAPHRARTVWIGAAVGPAARSAAGRRTASTATRRTGSATLGSAAPGPQVSELKARAEQSRRSEGRAKPDCGAGGLERGLGIGKKKSPRSGRDNFRGAMLIGARTFLSMPLGIHVPLANSDYCCAARQSRSHKEKVRIIRPHLLWSCYQWNNGSGFTPYDSVLP